jgi:nucleosome binding factor SPN SPT16 subunit
VQLTADLVESCYTPIIQSGGVYDLKPSAVSNDDLLHFGTIVCSLGARYRHYCSNVARTYFVDPDKEQEDIYALLLEVHKLMIKALVPGNQVKKIMEVAVDYIQKKKPELVPHFVKTGGFGVRPPPPQCLFFFSFSFLLRQGEIFASEGSHPSPLWWCCRWGWNSGNPRCRSTART